MKLTSSAFTDGGTIPTQYTCDGANLSPPLHWANTPPATRAFALICHDPDATGGDWVHWVIYGIPAHATGLPENMAANDTLADGSIQGVNGNARIGYGGPCPPPGRPHRYVFTLYALDSDPALGPGLAKPDLQRAIHGRILAEAQLIGLYQRRP